MPSPKHSELEPNSPDDNSGAPAKDIAEASTETFTEMLADAVRLDRARAHAEAARRLDDGLKIQNGAPAPLRFQALVLRADLAVTLNELIEARGILAEAKQVVLTQVERDGLGADLRRVDDLEVFLTHRGCAG